MRVRFRNMVAMLAAAPLLIGADTVPDYGARLERFEYPWPVRTVPMAFFGIDAEMAYMDIAPVTPNGRTVVLLHGKNFCGATWQSTAQALISAGYRVIVPDQIGFCKSSKPQRAQYSFAMMADATRRLLRERGVTRAAVVGHSMGGMLAMRYAIMFPQDVERLVLVNPLGLNDPSETGVPYTPVEQLWATEREQSYRGIIAYQRQNYYHGTWKPAYDRWARMSAGMLRGGGRDEVAYAQARTSEMIYTQPVAHELGRILAPTTLIVGMRDGTAFGRAQLPKAEQKRLPAIPAIASEAVRRFRNARLVPFDDLGHSPQVEAPARFERTLLTALSEPRA